MLPSVISRLGLVRNVVMQHARRNIAITAAVSQKVDPIQQLFVDKIREYGQKSKASGSGLVDATPETEELYKMNIDKVNRIYSAEGQDMTAFPTFNFADTPLEGVGVGGDMKAVQEEEPAAKASSEEHVTDEDNPVNTPYFDIF